MSTNPTQEAKDALLRTLDQCEPDAWPALVAYCLPELVKEQRLLADIICREAERRAERATTGSATHYVSDHLASVLDELKLKLTVR